jgi:hypothetical protein
MKLPEQMIQHVHGLSFMYLGTRSDKLIPFVNRVLGAIVEKDQESITVYMLESQSHRTLENLKHNGKCALFITEPVSHESYQFKGDFISARPCNENDEAIQGIYFQKVANYLSQLGVPEAVLYNFVSGPMIAVTFRVEEVYDQTPKPGAGQKIIS